MERRNETVDDLRRDLGLIPEQDDRAGGSLADRGYTLLQRCALTLSEVRIDDELLAVVADRGCDPLGIAAKYQNHIREQRPARVWPARCRGSGWPSS